MKKKSAPNSFLKKFIKPKEQFSVGIDIGSSSVKAVKFKVAEGAVELCDFIIEPVSADTSTALKKIRPMFEAKNIAVAASGPSALVRYVTLPKMTSSEVKQALKFEAQKYIPYSISEVNIDSAILKDDFPENKMLLLIAAAKKEFVVQRLKMLQDAGITASAVDLDSVALVNAFNFSYEQDERLKNATVALLNIGASETNLNLLEDGIPRLSRDIHLAGVSFTQKVADYLGVDFTKAETLKKDSACEQKEKVAIAVEAALTNLATEIRSSFDYYESQSASSVGKIFLSGGSSLFAGLKESLYNLLGIEVLEWNPFLKIKTAPSVNLESLNKQMGYLHVAVGLALRK